MCHLQILQEYQFCVRVLSREWTDMASLEHKVARVKFRFSRIIDFQGSLMMHPNATISSNLELQGNKQQLDHVFVFWYA